MGDIRTFCRICEPSCGLVARVEEGHLVKLSPDRDHPVTKGFACHKGLAAVDVHADPDRLDEPQLRAPDGSLTTVSWDEAIAHTATRLQAVVAEQPFVDGAKCPHGCDRRQRGRCRRCCGGCDRGSRAGRRLPPWFARPRGVAPVTDRPS